MSLLYKLIALLIAVVVLTWAIISAAPFIAICTILALLYVFQDSEDKEEKPPQ